MSDKALNLAEQAFLHTINQELERGELRFPTSMEVTMRVLEALDNPDLDLGRMSTMVSAEPLLAARTVALANSAWYNPSGRVVTDVPKALVRIGFGKLRALAMAVAAEQLMHREVLGPYQPLIRKLWAHCVDVAATASVLARLCTAQDRDAAFFAGMVHDIGQFFLLARVWEYPELLNDDSPLSDLVRVWHAPVGRAVLAAMSMPRELVDAVDNPEIYGGEWPPTTIPDLIFIANLVAESRNPFSPEDEDFRRGLARAATLGLDEARLEKALAESAEERQALMALFHVG
ncbi:HDOD domain-containing protein [Zoogloea sp.]|uniref:HDOD domain-containing protein n=1 Tax=Zoogloea sp. TaxID=49181 RepID=UPI0025DBD9EC|nr:HDOD domain-containing protein [Zoogloea sp.]MCK6395016.1 HDOD domain-containing protein [Zoogloea sp.]